MARLDRHGVGLHYEVGGDGEGAPVLLTHGFSATGDTFRSTVQALRAAHRCLVWDVRGHGRSDYPTDDREYSIELTMADMSALLDAEGIGRTALVGHSMGGYLSLEFQRRHPDRVRALVLVGTGPGYRRDDARNGWNEMCERMATALEKRGFNGLPGGSDEVRADAHRDATGLARAARGILTQRDSAVLDGLPRIAVPTLVVVGENDATFRPGSTYMAEKIPGARLVVIPGAGHAPMITHAGAFEAEVSAFLSGVG